MSTIPKTSKLIPRSHVEFHATRTGGILVNMLAGTCFELTRVGAEVWTRLAAGNTVGNTVGALGLQYDVATATIEDDVNHLCEGILAAGLVDRLDE